MRAQLTIAIVALSLPLCAQNQGSEGTQLGDYTVQQTIEVGARFIGQDGNTAVYDTFVNLQTGPRILEQSLNMRSRDHDGLLFDELNLESFGYGGDPNTASRLRMSKDRWYDFRASFRRDLNVWDYDLLANPLNPPTSSPALPLADSPHRFSTVRRLGDYQLTLLPQSAIHVRLGYSHNISEGQSLSSVNVGGFEGLPTVVSQPWRDSQDSYRLGVDLGLLPRTNFSFDEFYSHEKGDTSWLDQNFGFRLPKGAPLDLGAVFNVPFLPCAGAITSFHSTPAVANPICNGFLAYSRSAPARTSIPTEQVSFESAYFKQIEISGLFSYSSARTSVPNFSELFQGLVIPLTLRQQVTEAATRARIITTSGDLGITWSLTPNLRISDSFDWRNFHVSGTESAFATALFSGSLTAPPQAFNSASCPAPFTAATCPQHTLDSPPDVLNTHAETFLGQDQKENLLQLEYDFSGHAGARVGYRYGQQDILQSSFERDAELFFPIFANRSDCLLAPLAANGTCSVTTLASLFGDVPIHRHSALAAVWLRFLRADRLRLNFETEIMSADRSYTRVDPRQAQLYKARIRYAPRSWMTFATALNWREDRNNVAEVQGRGHDRSFSLSGTFARSPRLALDASYDYSNVFARDLICYISSALPAGTPLCATDQGLFQTTSFYDSTTHFGQAKVLWSPVTRVRANFGYSITSVDGGTQFLNPLAPIGSLRFNYHQPIAALAIDVRKGITWKGSWGYDDYDEKSAAGPTLPRSFHANLGTISLRYSF